MTWPGMAVPVCAHPVRSVVVRRPVQQFIDSRDGCCALPAARVVPSLLRPPPAPVQHGAAVVQPRERDADLAAARDEVAVGELDEFPAGVITDQVDVALPDRCRGWRARSTQRRLAARIRSRRSLPRARGEANTLRTVVGRRFPARSGWRPGARSRCRSTRITREPSAIHQPPPARTGAVRRRSTADDQPASALIPRFSSICLSPRLPRRAGCAPRAPSSHDGTSRTPGPPRRGAWRPAIPRPPRSIAAASADASPGATRPTPAAAVERAANLPDVAGDDGHPGRKVLVQLQRREPELRQLRIRGQRRDRRPPASPEPCSCASAPSQWTRWPTPSAIGLLFQVRPHRSVTGDTNPIRSGSSVEGGDRDVQAVPGTERPGEAEQYAVRRQAEGRPGLHAGRSGGEQTRCPRPLGTAMRRSTRRVGRDGPQHLVADRYPQVRGADHAQLPALPRERHEMQPTPGTFLRSEQRIDFQHMPGAGFRGDLQSRPSRTVRAARRSAPAEAGPPRRATAGADRSVAANFRRSRSRPSDRPGCGTRCTGIVQPRASSGFDGAIPTTSTWCPSAANACEIARRCSDAPFPSPIRTPVSEHSTRILIGTPPAMASCHAPVPGLPGLVQDVSDPAKTSSSRRVASAGVNSRPDQIPAGPAESAGQFRVGRAVRPSRAANAASSSAGTSRPVTWSRTNSRHAGNVGGDHRDGPGKRLDQHGRHPVAVAEFVDAAGQHHCPGRDHRPVHLGRRCRADEVDSCRRGRVRCAGPAVRPAAGRCRSP